MKRNVPTYRLESLDILRGFDLFILVFLQPVFMSFAKCLDWQCLQPVVNQFTHKEWEGFACWDLVMPLFIFMAGASLPFALSRFRKTNDTMGLTRRVVKRFLLLCLLGAVVQGNLLLFNLDEIRIYTDTLQAIAVGYVGAVLLSWNLKPKAQYLAMILLLIVYWVPMELFGDYTREGSFPYYIDQLVIGNKYHGDLSNTWVWSSMAFVFIVMSGNLAGQYIKDNSEKTRTAAVLFVCGAMLSLAGYLASFHTPIIKRIWTGSMVLLSVGYSVMLLAVFYYVIDCLKFKKGLSWLKIYGMNSITAYMLGEFINFRSISESVCYGLRPYMGEFYDSWITFTNFLMVFLILRSMYKHQIFWKV